MIRIIIIIPTCKNILFEMIVSKSIKKFVVLIFFSAYLILSHIYYNFKK
jgi:hypothetical protein